MTQELRQTRCGRITAMRAGDAAAQGDARRRVDVASVTFGGRCEMSEIPTYTAPRLDPTPPRIGFY